jgi:uncharacterized membrane protein
MLGIEVTYLNPLAITSIKQQFGRWVFFPSCQQLAATTISLGSVFPTILSMLLTAVSTHTLIEGIIKASTEVLLDTNEIHSWRTINNQNK